MAYRTMPFVRRELDKQLTVMVLVQVFINIFTLLPFPIVIILLTNPIIINNSLIQVNRQFALIVTLIIFITHILQ